MKPFLFEPDAEKKKEMFMKYYQESIKPMIEKLEEHLMKNGSSYLVGKSVSYYIFNSIVVQIWEISIFF